MLLNHKVSNSSCPHLRYPVANILSGSWFRDDNTNSAPQFVKLLRYLQGVGLARAVNDVRILKGGVGWEVRNDNGGFASKRLPIGLPPLARSAAQVVATTSRAERTASTKSVSR